DLVPLRELAVVGAMLERDAVERVAALHRVEISGRLGNDRGGKRLRDARVHHRRRRAAARATGREREDRHQHHRLRRLQAFPIFIGTNRTGSSSDSRKPRALRSYSTSLWAAPSCSGNIILPPGASWRKSVCGTWRLAA